MTDWLRWLAVLPAAILAAGLSQFPLHIILYQTLTGSGLIEPYPELPERLLTLLVAPAAFVWAGAAVAPRHRAGAAAVLMVLCCLLAGIAIALVLSGSFEFSTPVGVLAPIITFVGAFCGLLIVRKRGGS
ncbi:MAG: hypothetical protein CMJ62_02620 [Planctomycetaceae bacterium]|nr:hypothetical protein [Planctomycetaceae bacterium]